MTQCSVDVVVPWRGGCTHRARAWSWVQRQYAQHLPAARVVVACAPAGVWCKGRAVATAVAASGADIIVVGDADVWCDNTAQAILEVAAGAAWAVPHLEVHRLTQRASDEALAGAAWLGLECVQRPYPGILGGGLVALPRAVASDIIIDPRFTGWGQEDESWAIALYALLGNPWRGDKPLLHLWHPPQERMSRTRGSKEGWRLRRRYFEARFEPSAMRALIEEAHADLRTSEPPLHAAATHGVG